MRARLARSGREPQPINQPLTLNPSHFRILAITLARARLLDDHPPSGRVAATTPPNTLCGVRWRTDPSFRLVAIKDVRRLTGLEPAEVLRRPGTQELIRIDESGVREKLLRLPVELLIEDQEG